MNVLPVVLMPVLKRLRQAVLPTSRARNFNTCVSLVRSVAACVALIVLAAVASFLPRSIIFAQASPAFDAASIKKHTDQNASTEGGAPTTGSVTFDARPGGRLHVVNNPISNVIQNAYGIAHYQLVGAPDWVNSDRYDIEARGAATAGEKEMMLMVQALLADRFAMRSHFETRDRPAFTLTVAKGGSKIHFLASEDCTPRDTTRPSSEAVPNVCGNNHLSRNNVWTATHISMPGVTGVLSAVMRSPVIDRTGLRGTFDVRLQWSDDLQDNPADAPPPFSVALRETLGLELKPGRGPVQVLIIDHIERPTSN